MKNIFRIHPITYLVIMGVLLSGYFNYFLIISIILFFHDLGHLLFIKIFKYKLHQITILPFGSVIDTNVNQNSPSIHILIISLGGALMQLILFLILPPFLNQLSYQIFLKYNLLLLIFNLLPIIPLDGSKIMQVFFESVLSYKLSLWITNIISVIALIIFTLVLEYHALNAYLIIIFLVYKTYERIKHHSYEFHQFLLTRCLNEYHNKKVKYVKRINQIFKNRYNFIGGKSEEKVLSLKFKC